MPEYYHVSVIDHAIGTILQPGRSGLQYRQYVTGGGVVPANHHNAYNLTWETVLEATRRLSVPHFPSRLNCIFATTTEDAAKAFRDKWRAGSPIFKIDVAEDIPTFIGDLGSLNNSKPGDTFIDYWIETAIKYWKDQPPGATEILIGGPVKIVQKIPG